MEFAIIYLLSSKVGGSIVRRKIVISFLLFLLILFPEKVNADGFREICSFDRTVGHIWDELGTHRQNDSIFNFSFQSDGSTNRLIITDSSDSSNYRELTQRNKGFTQAGTDSLWFSPAWNSRWGVHRWPKYYLLHFRIAEEDVEAFFDPDTCNHSFYLKTLGTRGNSGGPSGSGGLFINYQIQRTRPRPDENGETAGNQVLHHILYGVPGEVTTNQPQDCDSILGDPDEPEDLAWLLGRILAYFRILGPSLVIVLSSIDFAKAVIASDEEASIKARKKLLIRTLLAMSLFLLPDLVSLIMGIAGLTHDNATCGL